VLAAKVCQEEWLRTRSSDAVASLALPDLPGTVRPALDAIGKRMLVALVDVRKSGKSLEVIRN
jgi:hypothetical protein